MKIKLRKKNNKDKPRTLEQEESITIKKDTTEITKNKRNLFQIPVFREYNALMKLRIVVSVIFSLCTIALILILAGSWLIAFVLLLIGYLLLFIFMIKLLITKKL
jgi:fatty acid desaturase